MHAAQHVDLMEGIASGVLSHFRLVCLHLPFLLVALRVDLMEGIASGVLSHFQLVCLHLPSLLVALLVGGTQAPTCVPLSPAPECEQVPFLL